jgi:hypothetical protein
MTNALHLVLKFKNEKFEINERKTNTIAEHKQLLESKGRLIWGQGSRRKVSGVAEKNRGRIIQQIKQRVSTYTFFLANNNGMKELYVGRMTNIYDRGEITLASKLKDYIPNYYSINVGTDLDEEILFVDVTTFFKIDSKYLNNIKLESNHENILSIRNSSSIFLVNIDEELENFLANISNNIEENYQYQVEQEVISEDIILEDRPKDKPIKTLENGTTTYKRDVKTSKNAIVMARYLCEIDQDHKNFTSRVTGKNYVEAHHLIPMEYQDDFESSIDVEANIISLCVNCHKKLHHGEFVDIEPMLEKLYRDRINRLNDCNVNITKDKLLKYYK